MLTWDQIQRIAFEGGWITIQVFVGAAVLGTVLSVIFGVMGLAPNRNLRGFSRVYVEVARGASAIILLFWAARAFPILAGFQTGEPWEAGPISIEPLLVFAIVALGASMGGYGAEVVRAGIGSIPKGQTEASVSLSLTFLQRLRYVILPQAVVTMLPPYGNLNIEILKGTALVSLIGLSDITFEAQKLRSARTAFINQGLDAPSTAWIFTITLVIYFILSQVLSFSFRGLERLFGGRWHKGRD